MPWFSKPRHHPRYHHNSSIWRAKGLQIRPTRILSWSLCLLVLLAIVLWPQKRGRWPQKRDRWPRRVRVAQSSRWATTGPSPEKQKPVGETTKHVYRTDGLVNVNPRGEHPIFELIEHSETQWKRKLARQSKSLKQAVEEYKRRYKRPPPKGFEIWWDYVDYHNVKLVDEYDSIHTRLNPFWAIDPANLRANQLARESYPDTFTIGKLPGSTQVTFLNDTMQMQSSPLRSQRVQDQLEILEEIQEHLPEFRATFTVHDNPAHFVSSKLIRQAEEAVERGEYIDPEHVAGSIAPTDFNGFAAGCPPDSPIHAYIRTHAQSPPPSSPSVKSFIYNHRLSMSPCLHPTHLTHIGYLSQFRYNHQFGPTPHRYFAPIFAICVTSLHSDLLAPAPEQFVSDVGQDLDWEDKVDDRLLWRGSNTGTLHQEGNLWNLSQRIRLVEMGTRRSGEVRVLLPHAGDRSTSETPPSLWDGPVGYGETVRASTLNAAFMDVAFVDKPKQCEEPVCTELERMFEWRPYQTWDNAWTYKYIIDVDGNGWSARFKRLMTSKSLVFKSTIFPEWYTERIMPWVHYIPVQVDFSDLYDILAFFRGDLSGAGAHDDLAQKIATAGKEWSESFYRREDMTAYQFRLILEYARVMSLDREGMSYKE